MPATVLLVNPWIYDFAAANFWAAPLGLLRLAQALKARGYSLLWLDCLDNTRPGKYGCGQYPKLPVPRPDFLKNFPREFGRFGIPLESFRACLRNLHRIDAIFVSSGMTYWYPGVWLAIRELRRALPHVPIGLGGIYARLCPEHARASGADQIFLTSQAEESLSWLVQLGVLPEGNPAPLPSLAAVAPWPHPAFAPLLTSEGCPYACHFCASPNLWPAYRSRPIAEVLEEIQAWHALQTKDFAFYDDALLFKAQKHFIPLMHAFLELGLTLRFHTPNGLHAKWLSPEVAQLMRRADFRTIRLSLETIQPKNSMVIDHKVSSNDCAQAVENLRAAGIRPNAIGIYLMYGLPDQSPEEVWEGIRFIKQLGVGIHLTEFSPIPGTPLWRQLLQAGILNQDSDLLLTNNTVYSHAVQGLDLGQIQAWRLAVRSHNQNL